MTIECSVGDCSKPVKSKTLCSAHYERMRKRGTLMLPKRQLAFERFDQTYSETESGCLVWSGAKTHNGYGQLNYRGETVRAHRYAWEQFKGPIPDGMVVDHLCFTRACVNVDHMRLLTAGQNQQNREGAQDRNRSGLRGVYWHKEKGKWTVRIGIGGKHHFGGYFTNKEEAGRVASSLRAELLPYSQN